MWNVGFSSCSKFRLTSLHTGASGSTCTYRCLSAQTGVACKDCTLLVLMHVAQTPLLMLPLPERQQALPLAFI